MNSILVFSRVCLATIGVCVFQCGKLRLPHFFVFLEENMENYHVIIPIEVSARNFCPSTIESCFVRCVFNALREHKELLNSPDYKRLYDEAIDYLYRCASYLPSWKAYGPERGYEWLEFIFDIANPNIQNKLSINTVNSFLDERRKIWDISKDIFEEEDEF